MMRFFSRICFSLAAGCFSQRKQPPPGLGYLILYFSANSICFFLERPENPASAKGLAILNFISLSIVFCAFAVWDMGLCPGTSPVAIMSCPCLSAYSFAFLNINILQSMQGFIPTPVPNFGFFNIERYSDRSGSFVASRIVNFKLSIFLQIGQLHPNGSVK